MGKNKIALITGVSGQDGAYLSKLLLEKGYTVFGFIRATESLDKLEHLSIKNKLNLISCDLLNFDEIKKNIENIAPNEIYNFAAQSSVNSSFIYPADTIRFNILSVLNLLEVIRLVSDKIRFFQASSCEIFGNIKNLPITENTRFLPENPYAVSKFSAHNIVLTYRKLYNLFACCGILFNHESYLRAENFFVKKVVKQAIEIKFGKRDCLKVGNINIKRDLGYAPAYVEAMWLMLQQNVPDDFVISSGKSVLLQDIIFYVFDKLNLNKNKIVIDKELFRETDIHETLGDNSKAKTILGWDYSLDFYSVLDLLIAEEIQYFK